MDTERIERTRKAMEGERLDVLVCRLPENILFLTGYWPLSGTSFLLFPRDGEPVCIVPKVEETEARESLGSLRALIYPAGTLTDGDMYESVGRCLLEESGSRRWKTIGYEGSFETMAPAWNASESFVSSRVTMAMFERTWGSRRMRDATDLLFRLRSRKTSREVEAIRTANEIACFGLQAFQDAVAPGRTGIELVAAVEHAVMTRGTGHHGAKRVRAFAQVAVGREETALGWRPMEISTTRRLAEGDLAVLELGVVADGLWSDRTRARAAGEPTARQREIHQHILRAQQAAIAKVAPGVAAKDVDAAARSVLDAAGLQKEFLHITGHGTGFRYHEPIPFIAPGNPALLEEGMIFSVEPGVYSAELGGLRLEDNVVVMQAGGEVLGPFDTGLAR
jgi:Xaa-Pro aminopeptidase